MPTIEDIFDAEGNDFDGIDDPYDPDSYEAADPETSATMSMTDRAILKHLHDRRIRLERRMADTQRELKNTKESIRVYSDRLRLAKEPTQ